MNLAIQAVINKEMGYYKAAKQFNVPQQLWKGTQKKKERRYTLRNKQKGWK
jgi:hypothetical protein